MRTGEDVIGTTDDERDGREVRSVGKIEVAQETARVDVVERVTGRVSVRTRTETHEESVDTVLESVGADVRRVDVNRYLEEGEAVPRARQEGDTWILPVLEEVVTVEKRLLLKEELHVTQTGDRQEVSVPVTLRRQVAEIERVPAAETSAADTGEPRPDDRAGPEFEHERN